MRYGSHGSAGETFPSFVFMLCDTSASLSTNLLYISETIGDTTGKQKCVTEKKKHSKQTV